MLRLEPRMAKDFSLPSFVVAGAITFVAVAARAALDPTMPTIPPFITLYPAVAVAGLLCGPWAGATTCVIGLAASVYLWFPPKFSFELLGAANWVSVGLFVATSAIILWVAAFMRAQLAEASLAKSALALGLSAGGVGAWEINLRTMRITASAAAHELHGLPENQGQTTTEDWMRGVHHEDIETARATLRAALVDGAMASYSYRILRHPRGPRWISARGKVVNSGAERRLLCALVDITDQVEMQEELRRERERLRLALEAGSLAVWDFDPGTGRATVDMSYSATMGFDPETKALTPEQIGERIHPDDLARVSAEHDALLASGAKYHIEYRFIAPSGDIRWLASQGKLIKSDIPSDPGRLVGIIQDITNRRRREDDLRDLAAARELLVREADHRIKNSLQMVVSLLSLQLRGIEDASAAEALREAIARVNAIAASHLALQGSEDLREFDLRVTLQELCAHLGQLRPAINILYSPREALMLDADRAIPLGLCVSEIITNALRHAFPNRDTGTVVLEAAVDGAQLIIGISDDGVGLPANSGAAGLGSRIIRSLVTQIDATIHFDSAPQSGTNVCLRMPLRRAVSAA